MGAAVPKCGLLVVMGDKSFKVSYRWELQYLSVSYSLE